MGKDIEDIYELDNYEDLRDYDLEEENTICFIRNAPVAEVYFTQGRYISKIKELADKYPDEVKIKKINKSGSIIAYIPTSYIKINRAKLELSDEDREALRERARCNFGHDKASASNG